MATEYLTQEAFDRLSRELELLETTKREEIRARIEEARTHGDISENAELDSAKEEQEQNEIRIAELGERLANAKVGRAEVEEGTVGQGMVVTVVEDGDTEDIFLGARDERPAGLAVVSATSPMGRALDGAKIGATVTWTVPTGETHRAVVKAAKPL